MGTPYNNQLEQGFLGGNVIDDTTQTDGKFGGLLIVEDAVIDTWTCSNLTNSADLAGPTLPAGIYIPAKFTSITLTSGTVIAYTRDQHS